MAGPFLVDTGLHPSVATKPVANLGRSIARFSRPKIQPGEDLPAQLRAKGVDPKSMRLVVMTHMHFDHASGMSDFPGAAFVITEDEWIAAADDSRPFLRGYRHQHYDYAFDYRTLSYEADAISSYATFGRTFDLFGDGSVRLASTPGHSAGHQSVICRLGDRDLVIAGDAIYTIGQLEGRPRAAATPSTGTGGGARCASSSTSPHLPAGGDPPGPRPRALETTLDDALRVGAPARYAGRRRRCGAAPRPREPPR